MVCGSCIIYNFIIEEHDDAMADAKVDELNQDNFIFDVINVVNGLCDIYLFSHAMSTFLALCIFTLRRIYQIVKCFNNIHVNFELFLTSWNQKLLSMIHYTVCLKYAILFFFE